ncbi:hypothetical protein UFOVP87_45 [uncultured Caudovirales phage]|uniref:Phage protein n=1 Tax=uncultured Caudovirales phage TaxID=2100421 RepID=A0A6J5L3I1_9CAUD|nr:hypothetical protein UFOVP87_45 [uncultured Caudovirales phage]
MAKNKLEDLRNHLFTQLERLSDDEDMSDTDKLETELSRAKAIADVAQVIVNTAKLEIDIIKAYKDAPANMSAPTFLGLDNKK